MGKKLKSILMVNLLGIILLILETSTIPRKETVHLMPSLLSGNIRISIKTSLTKVQLMRSSFMNVLYLQQKIRKI